MQMQRKNIFKLLIKELFNLPIWIKQIIFLELRDEFQSSGMKNYLDLITKDTSFQLYMPKLTYSGRKELEKKTGKFSQETYAVLEAAFQELSVIETAISNNWNLHDCSKHFLTAVDEELIVNPTSSFIKGTALYMSGRIRLGEYFVKIDKITMEQLDEALRNQKYIEDSVGDRPGLADILVDLGFLTKEDTKGILFLKKDCHKYFKPDLLQKENLLVDTETGS